jgi:hypothetical protein
VSFEGQAGPADRFGLRLLLVVSTLSIYVAPVIGAVLIGVGVASMIANGPQAVFVVIVGAGAFLGIPIGLIRRRQARDALRYLDERHPPSG